MSSRRRIGYRRLVLGLLIAPALFPIYLSIIPYFDFYVTGGLELELHVVIGAVMSYVGLAILGLPYILLLREKDWLKYWTIMGPTLLLTAAVVILEQASLYKVQGFETGVMSAAPGVLLVGICFYLVVVWRYGPDATWPLLLSMAFVWLLHFACVAIQRHNFLSSNPISDTGAALGLMIVTRGGRMLSIAVTSVLVCIWVVFHLLHRKLAGSGESLRRAAQGNCNS